MFIDFVGFSWIWCHNALRPGTTLRSELWPLKKTLLDPSGLLFHRFSAIFMIFMDFGAWVPKNGKIQPVAPRESFTRFQLAAIIDFHRFSDILIDFHRFCWFFVDLVS